MHVVTISSHLCPAGKYVKFFLPHRVKLISHFEIHYTNANRIMESQKSESASNDAAVSKEVYLSASDTQAPSEVDSESQQWAKVKTVHRKVDRRIVFWYSFVYLIMRIHVSNITNTAIINEETHDDILDQLSLSSQQWAWCLSIFYYPYGAFEPISTLLLKRFKPNVWMSRIMITWGIISMCQGATQNYAGLLACRFMLGFAEAVIPVCFIICPSGIRQIAWR